MMALAGCVGVAGLRLMRLFKTTVMNVVGWARFGSLMLVTAGFRGYRPQICACAARPSLMAN